jgi:hypothetical protein
MTEADQVIPEVILFEHRYFHGAHKHVFGEERDLNAADDKLFFKKTSSIVVKGTRTWLFYPKQDFTGSQGLEVKPGLYETTEEANPQLKDNEVQSLKPK